MNALEKIAKIKGSGMKPWRQALYVDHWCAEPVLVGGARHAARMSTKHWSDPDILEFIEIKRPIEYAGMTMEEVIAKRKEYADAGEFPPMAFLWSSNNSVTVDDEFWHRARLTKGHPDYQSPRSKLARDVLQRVAECSYGDGTGEPGFINQHLLTSQPTGQDTPEFRTGDYVGSNRYHVKDETRLMLQRIHKAVRGKKWTFIVNPCGHCVTADTMVMTVEGPRPVAALMSSGFEALINGRQFAASAFRQVGIAPIHEIVTVEGYRLKCSAEHRLLRSPHSGTIREDVFAGAVTAGNLEIGDRIAMINNRRIVVDPDDPDFEVGWAVGHIKGNGGHNPHNSSGTYLRFWHSEEYNLEARADAFVRSLGVSRSYRGGSSSTANGTWTIRTEQLSLLVDKYLRPRSKAIRPSLVQGTTALVAGFLQGFFDSDGSPQGNATKGRSIRLSQSNEMELRITQQMLLRLGIMSTLSLRRDAGSRPMPNGRGGQNMYKHKSQWEIIISKNNVEEFAQKVGFSNQAKNEKLADLIASLTRRPNCEAFLTRVKEVNIIPAEPVFDCLVEGSGIYDADGFCSLSGMP